MSLQKYLGNILNFNDEDNSGTFEFYINKSLVVQKVKIIEPGSYLLSQNGDYSADFQKDGNFVVYVSHIIINKIIIVSSFTFKPPRFCKRSKNKTYFFKLNRFL